VRSKLIAAAAVVGISRLAIVNQALAASSHEPQVIENRGQAMPKAAARLAAGSRAGRKARARAAGLELMQAQQLTLDVSRLHPRWLRAAVQELMAAGLDVTPGLIGDFRRMGVEHTQRYVGVYCGR